MCPDYYTSTPQMPYLNGCKSQVSFAGDTTKKGHIDVILLHCPHSRVLVFEFRKRQALAILEAV